MVDLENGVWLVLIMFHVNVRVESGFSINDSILLENILQETIVAVAVKFKMAGI